MEGFHLIPSLSTQCILQDYDPLPPISGVLSRLGPLFGFSTLV